MDAEPQAQAITYLKEHRSVVPDSTTIAQLGQVASDLSGEAFTDLLRLQFLTECGINACVLARAASPTLIEEVRKNLEFDALSPPTRQEAEMAVTYCDYILDTMRGTNSFALMDRVGVVAACLFYSGHKDLALPLLEKLGKYVSVLPPS